MEKIDLQLELRSILLFRQEHQTALKAMSSRFEASEVYWVVMIRDLVDVAGYTYSRIAKRMNVSPSTIQKLATQDGRRPRQNVFFQLMCLYFKVFYGSYRCPKVIHYVETQASSVLDRIPQAFFNESPF